jgi:hypothetical protein
MLRIRVRQDWRKRRGYQRSRPHVRKLKMPCGREHCNPVLQITWISGAALVAWGRNHLADNPGNTICCGLRSNQQPWRIRWRRPDLDSPVPSFRTTSGQFYLCYRTEQKTRAVLQTATSECGPSRVLLKTQIAPERRSFGLPQFFLFYGSCQLSANRTPAVAAAAP